MPATLTQRTGRIAALANTGNWAAAHPSGNYLVTACATTGSSLQLWSHNAGTFTLLQSQSVDSNTTNRIEWLDSEYLIVKGNSRYITTYRLVNNTLVKQTDMSSTLASNGGPNFAGVSYFAASADGARVLAIGTSSPMWVLYTHSAGQLTRVSGGLPTSNYARNTVAMTSDGLFIATTTTSNGSTNIIQVHKWSGTAYVLQNVTQPTITYSGNHAEFNGDYLAITSSGTKLSLYKLNRTTGALTACSIDTLPAADCVGCSWNGNYLAAGMVGSSPYLTWYLLVGDALVKQTNPTATANTVMRAEWIGNYLVAVHQWSPYAMVYELVIPPKEFTIPKLTLSTTLYDPELLTTVRKYPGVGELTGESLAAVCNFQFATVGIAEFSTGDVTTIPGLVGVAELSVTANTVAFHASLTTTTAEAVVEALTPEVIISAYVPVTTAVLDHNAVTHNIAWVNSFNRYLYGNDAEVANLANGYIQLSLSVDGSLNTSEYVTGSIELTLNVAGALSSDNTAEVNVSLSLGVFGNLAGDDLILCEGSLELKLWIDSALASVGFQEVQVNGKLTLGISGALLGYIETPVQGLLLECTSKLEEKICLR